MNQNRLRISIIGLLMAVAVASFGCGGGGSGTTSAPGGAFIPAVLPEVGSTTGAESGNPVLDDPPSNEGGENEPTSTSTIVSTPGTGENTPTSPPKNSQPVQQPVESTPIHPGHGIDGEQQIIIPDGFSGEYGNIVIACPPTSHYSHCVVNVGADGSANYTEGNPSFRQANLPLPRATDAAQAPVLDFVNSMHVGANVAPDDDALTAGVERNGVSLSSGQVRDGIGSERLLAFLDQHANVVTRVRIEEPGKRYDGLETYAVAPTIRLAEGTSDLYARYAAHAVQLINSSMPYEKRITLSTEKLPSNTGNDDIPEGHILLDFNLPDGGFQLGGALLNTRTHSPHGRATKIEKAINARVAINEETMRTAYVHRPTEEDPHNFDVELPDRREPNTDTLIKFMDDEILLSVIVHELVHALGFHHIDESLFSDSIMHSSVDEGDKYASSPYLLPGQLTILLFASFKDAGSTSLSESEASQDGSAETETPIPLESGDGEGKPPGALITPKVRTVPGHILFPIDRAALLAAYGKFDPGTPPEDLTAENLGAWTDTSFHMRGAMNFPGGDAAFGVASANGLAQPWARGTKPWTELTDNRVLSGSVTWNGAILGVGSSSETVAGDASLSVNLSGLTGRIAFNNMEKWGANAVPGALGSGETWGDGDLGYTVEVRGNTFIQTGGDDGQVTGAFFGPAHEAMGGVLERADLAAGFGGKR